MPRRAHLPLLLLPVVVILTCSSPAMAQLGGLVKKVPKPPVPLVPSAPAPAAAEPAAEFTAELVDKMIAGLRAERAALEKETREAEAARARLAAAAATSDADQEERVMAMMQANIEGQQKYDECLEAAMLKDPDYLKLERLEMQAEDELDDEKAEKLEEQVSDLRATIRKRVEPACASLKSDLGNQMQQMVNADADKRRAEEEIISGVRQRATAAGAAAAQSSVADYAKRKEALCVGSTTNAKINSGDRALLDARAADLRPALRAIGCGVGTMWGDPDPPVK
jgi:hypothetical protein